tara:strand:- start:5592 stop:6263 length:672 start_codon:yes stop_codon:yes gene_type:complete
MKKILFTFCLLFILKIGYSQNSNDYKNEISIGVINLTKSPKNQEILFKNSNYLVPFSNLTYKRFFNERNAIRLTFYRPINKSYDNSGGSLVYKGEYKEQVLKMGYEYIFKQKRLTPYFAIDFSYLKSSSFREAGGGIIAGNYNIIENEIKGFGLSPTIGINYKIFKSIYIGFESNLNILKFNEEKITSTYQISTEPNEIRITEKDDYLEYIFNPVVFLIKFKF